jgi:hypothetical protein
MGRPHGVRRQRGIATGVSRRCQPSMRVEAKWSLV